MTNISQSGISLRGVTYNTPDQKSIFENISLNIKKETTAIIGDNGVGKSTLLRLISGEILPLQGNINKNGSLNYVKQFTDDISHKSGGQEQFARLMEGFNANSEFILLDEPSNNLDENAVKWLIKAIISYKGGVVFVSHDERLLRIANKFIEITQVVIHVFEGSYDEFKSHCRTMHENALRKLSDAESGLKQAKLSNQKRIEKQQKRDSKGAKKRLKNDAPKILLDAKKGRAEKSSGNVSLIGIRALSNAKEDLENAKNNIGIELPIYFDLPKVNVPDGKLLLEVDNINFGYEKCIFNNFSLLIKGQSKVLIKSKNGMGKTTLMRLIMGQIKPSLGNIKLWANVAYIDQKLGSIKNELSIFDNMKFYHNDLNDNQIYAKLARFKFRNKEVHKIAQTLSGGENLRLAFAIAFSGDKLPELLLLDEPTNNLDLKTKDILVNALKKYNGSMLIISHDTDFIDSLGDFEILELKANN